MEEPDGTVSILLTNLLDTRRFPRPAIIALYWRRWALETHYRDEKTLQHIEQFHSHTPDGIRQELFAILVGCVIARTLTALAVPSESIETAQSIVQPQLKNALMSFAREAALLTPALSWKGPRHLTGTAHRYPPGQILQTQIPTTFPTPRQQTACQ